MTHNIMRSTLTPALFFFFRSGIKLLKCDSPFLSLIAERAQELSLCKSIFGRSGLCLYRVICDGKMQFKMTCPQPCDVCDARRLWKEVKTPQKQFVLNIVCAKKTHLNVHEYVSVS